MKSNLALIIIFADLTASQRVVKTNSKRYYVLKSFVPYEHQDSEFDKYQKQFNVPHLMQLSKRQTIACKCSFEKSNCPKRKYFK